VRRQRLVSVALANRDQHDLGLRIALALAHTFASDAARQAT
jgi:hypothetical protein